MGSGPPHSGLLGGGRTPSQIKTKICQLYKRAINVNTGLNYIGRSHIGRSHI